MSDLMLCQTLQMCIIFLVYFLGHRYGVCDDLSLMAMYFSRIIRMFEENLVQKRLFKMGIETHV